MKLGLLLGILGNLIFRLLDFLQISRQLIHLLLRHFLAFQQLGLLLVGLLLQLGLLLFNLLLQLSFLLLALLQLFGVRRFLLLQFLNLTV